MKPRLRRGLYAPELLESRIAPATFIVTNLSDSGSGSLRDAVSSANSHPGTDTIAFKPGVSGAINLTSGVLNITEPAVIKGPGIDVITISGGSSQQIFHIDYTHQSLVPTAISGLSMIDGHSTSDGGALYSSEPTILNKVVVASSVADSDGGGAWIRTAGKVQITNSRFVQNSASQSGGLYMRGDAGATIAHSVVSYNSASSGTGGLYARATGTKAVVLIDSCVIANNTAAGSAGGAQIETGSTGHAIVRNSFISGNTSGSGGGGLYLEDGNILIDHSVIAGNSAHRGGGVADNSINSLIITGSRFIDNQATDNAQKGGGGLYLEGSHPVSIVSSLFQGNSSASGGGGITGIFVKLKVSGSTFLSNTASGSGGGIDFPTSSTLTVTHSLLTGNVSGNSGGGIAASAGATVKASGNVFTENKTSNNGGGLYTGGAGVNAVSLSLAGNLFSNNLADEGGGVATLGDGKVVINGDHVVHNTTTASDGRGFYLRGTSGITVTNVLVQGNLGADDAGGIAIRGNATISNSKILDNVCDYNDGRGGGVFVASGTVAINGSTITGNVAAEGGGVYDEGTTTITGSLVKGNSARSGPNTFGI